MLNVFGVALLPGPCMIFSEGNCAMWFKCQRKLRHAVPIFVWSGEVDLHVCQSRGAGVSLFDCSVGRPIYF